MPKKSFFRSKTCQWWETKSKPSKWIIMVTFSLAFSFIFFGIIDSLLDKYIITSFPYYAHVLIRTIIGFLAIMFVFRTAECSMEEHNELRELAFKDILTEVYRREFLPTTIEILCDKARDSDLFACAFFVDADYLKKINDTYGHEAGDNALCVIAQLLEECFSRRFDFVIRYGGDEFLVLCVCKNPIKLEEKLLQTLELKNIHFFHNAQKIPISVTMGMSYAKIEATDDHKKTTEIFKTIIKDADQKMCTRKKSR